VTSYIGLDPYYFDAEDYHLEPFKTAINGSSSLTVSLPGMQPNLAGIGQVSLQPGHILQFVPRPQYVGFSSILFIVCDSVQLCSEFTLTINVSFVNHPPTFKSVPSVQVKENDVITVPIQVSDFEDDACPANIPRARFCVPLNLTIGQQASGGVGELIFTANAKTGTWALKYTPTTYFHGNDRVVLQLCDFNMACVSTTVTISVLHVDQKPFFNLTNLVTLEETPISVDLLTYTWDPDGPLPASQLSIIDEPSHGVATYDSTTGMMKYTPEFAYFGLDHLTIQVCSSATLCITQVVEIKIEFVDHFPQFVPLKLSVYENLNLTVNLSVGTSDVEDGVIPPSRISINQTAAFGKLTYNSSTGIAAYVPNADYNGRDSFTYSICDSLDNCTIATASITVLPVNNAPRLRAGFSKLMPYATLEDTYNFVVVFYLHYDPDLSDVPPLDMSAGASPFDSQPADLKLTITRPTKKGTLVPYSKYGIVTYKPIDQYWRRLL